MLVPECGSRHVQEEKGALRPVLWVLHGATEPITLFDIRVGFQIVKFQLPGGRGNLSDTHKIKIKKLIGRPVRLGSRKEHSGLSIL